MTIGWTTSSQTCPLSWKSGLSSEQTPSSSTADTGFPLSATILKMTDDMSMILENTELYDSVFKWKVF